ncbi:flagellar protein [Crassaminicella thermophila]|uniref:Flagellar protein n=1 Tax=Crassaminicella thermophila TaxID=2599308 RepID=A0A5C0SDU2_CRATE|nr:flagellar FlbD family protein [Crassaminicella thermophila]QEK12270.1 flagellar protein [Crassaminicella thermophila]
MITVSKLNGKKCVINSDLIEHIETTPDTVITLTTGKKIIVLESIDQIIDKIIQYKRKIYSHSTILQNLTRNEV